MYSQELANEYLKKQLPKEALLAEISMLYVSNAPAHKLQPFYLLHWALDDLKEQGFQYYYDNVSLENFDSVLNKEIAKLFLITHPSDARPDPMTNYK